MQPNPVTGAGVRGETSCPLPRWGGWGRGGALPEDPHPSLPPAGEGADRGTATRVLFLMSSRHTTRSAETSHATYKRDTALCMSPRYASGKADCLSEASTARASREPANVDPDPGRYMQNAQCAVNPFQTPIEAIALHASKARTPPRAAWQVAGITVNW